MTTLALPESPAGSAAAAPARPTPLAQCLVLAGLLHLLLVLVFGNTPGGSAKAGEGLWGAFQVRLVGNGPAGQPEPAVLETLHTGAPGQADRQRFGGAVRPADTPSPVDAPGAARAGRWLPQVAEGDAQAPPLETAAAAPAAAPMAAAELPARQSVDAIGPLALPAAVDLPPFAAPVLTAAPAPPRFEPEAPQPARTLAPRPAARPLAPLASTDLPAPPAPQPALPSFPVQAAPPPRTLAQRERPSAVGMLAPAELPAAPVDAPPLPNFAAQLAAPPRAVAARAAPSTVTPPTSADLPTPAETPALPSFAVAPPDASALAAAPVPASPAGVKQVAGAPDAGARLGHDLATAPSLPASAARLNLDLVRPRGGPIAAQGSRGLLSVVPHPPEVKTKLEKDIELSGLADCRKAYSAMGLAAAVPLLADALRAKGCRW